MMHTIMERRQSLKFGDKLLKKQTSWSNACLLLCDYGVEGKLEFGMAHFFAKDEIQNKCRLESKDNICA